MMVSPATGNQSEATERRLHPDDVLLALLTLGAPTGGGQRLFPASSPKLHSAFHTLFASEQAAGLLDVFAPLRGAPYPYSSQLARSLAHLERSRLVGKHNPDFERYFVEDDADQVYERRVKPRLLPGDEDRLRRLSEQLWCELSQADA